MSAKTSTVKYMGELRTEAVHLRSGEKIITDAPVDNHGKGEAFSPTDLTATSLLSCMISLMGIVSNNRGFNMGQVDGTVKKIMAEGPRRIAAIEIEIFFKDHALSASDRRLLEHTALNCPVAKSLHPDIQVTTRFEYD